VTGTAVGGMVRPGDRLRRLPGGEVLRVRSVEVHGEPVDVAQCGQRVALNVTGHSHGSIARGDVVCDDRIAVVSSRFDARLEVRPGARMGIKDYQRIRVHLGTAERLGKAIVLGPPKRPGTVEIAAGETAYCQIVLTEPLHLLRDDRFIVRDETAQRTIGGGVVVHPAASRHRRNDSDLVARLDAFARGDEVAILREQIAASGEFSVSLLTISQFSNRRQDDVRARLDASPAARAFVIGGEVHYALAASCRQVHTSLLDIVRSWHGEHPLSPGIGLEEARARLAVQVPQKIFKLLVDELVADAAIAREGNTIGLPEYCLVVSETDTSLVESIKTSLRERPMAPPDAGELADRLGVDRVHLGEVLRVMQRRQTIVSVAGDMYFLGDWLDRVRGELIEWLAAKGRITTAEFRDHYRTSRKYAIPLLEYFDREGVTVRKGDVRELKRTGRTETA